jgi:uncharacterized membrane protein
MRVILFIVAVIAFLLGVGMFLSAKSAMHEIVAFSSFNIAAVSLGCAAIVDVLIGMKKQIDNSNEQMKLVIQWLEYIGKQGQNPQG